MKALKIGFIGLLTLLLWGCSGERARMQSELDRSLMACDSTIYTLEKRVSTEEMKELLNQSAAFQQELEATLQQNDTLSLTDARKIDRLLAAYQNAEFLNGEREVCLKRAELQRERIKLLKKDIENASGDRSAYERQVRIEKRELTKIRTHCNDIRLRFEELKSAASELRATMH